MRRMEMALGVTDIEEIAERISGFFRCKSLRACSTNSKCFPSWASSTACFPKTVSDGPCKEVILRKDFSLDAFPILHCWPGDGGRFITLPMVFSNNPETGKRNCGMYRMQVFDGKTTGMHWQKHKQGAEHYRRLISGREN